MITVKIIDAEHKTDVRLPNDPFQLFGRIVPSFDGNRWDYDVVRFAPEMVTEMCFPSEDYDFDAMTDSVFIGAYDDGNCVGLLLLQPAFFKYMHIVDLKVSEKYRRRQIGRMLLEKAKEVAAQRGYCGLYLECQDDNPGAFLFYVNSGFYIGGLNTNVYRHTSLEGSADILMYCEVAKNMNIEYKGGFIFVDGKRYACSAKVEEEMSDARNQREYVERIEVLACQVFDLKTRENDGLFYEC